MSLTRAICPKAGNESDSDVTTLDGQEHLRIT